MKNFNQYIMEKIKLSKDRFNYKNITYDELAAADWCDLPEFDINGRIDIDNGENFEICFGKIDLNNKIIGAWSYLWIDDREGTSVFTLILQEGSINSFISDEELKKHKYDDDSNMPDNLVDMIDEKGVFYWDRHTTYVIEEYTSAWAASMADWAAIADMEEKFDNFYEKIIKPIGNIK